MKSDCVNPKIEYCDINDNNCLKFSFKGTLVEEDAKNAIEVWKNFFKEREGEMITLIWDCKEMSGYDPGARIAWQNALKELKNQIANIWLISKSNLIRSGAMIVSMFTKLNIKVVQSESEIFVHQ